MEITEEVVVVKFRELIKNMAISLKSNVKQMIIRSIITAVIVMVLNLIVQLIPAYEGSYLMHLRTSSLSWGALTGLVLSLVSTVKVEGVSTLLRSVRPAFNGMMNFTKNEHKGFFGVGIVGAIILTFILNDPTFALSFGVVGFLSIGRQNNSKLMMFLSSIFSSILRLFSKKNAFKLMSCILSGATMGFALHGLFTSTGTLFSIVVLLVFIVINLIKLKKGGKKNEEKSE